MNQQTVFFFILILIYVLHNVGLSWLFKRQHNKDDNFIGRKAPNETQRFFGRAMFLIIAYYALVLVYTATDFDFWGLLSTIAPLDKAGLQMLGFGLSLLFLLLMTLARFNLGGSWRVGLDHSSTDALVTGAFYRHIRNPYFAFLLAFEASLILVSPNTVTLLAFIQSALLLNLQVRQEEIFLHEKYGDQYTAYMNRTGRFLPKLLA